MTTVLDFVERKMKEAHDDTWRYFRAGEKPSCEWVVAKEKEMLCGEIIRFIIGEVNDRTRM
jgi:hypothetical protein